MRAPPAQGATYASLSRRFARLTFLNILANLTIPLTGLVDTAMLGHLDDIRFLGGVALGSVLFDYLYWSFGFLRMGTTGMTALAVGRGDTRAAFLVLYRSLAIGVVVAAAVLLLREPLGQLGFAILSGTDAVEHAGRGYFDARVLGAPAAFCNLAFFGWFLGREESGRALVIAVIGNTVNIVLNYVFIVRLGLAAWGAGLASALGQYATLSVALALFALLALRDASARCGIREVLDLSRMRSLLRLNADILVRTVCLITAFALFTNASSLLGTAFLVANAVLLRVLTTVAYLVDGVAFATESLAGLLRGRRDLPGIQRLLRLALACGGGFSILLLGAVLAAPGAVYGLLTSHEDVVAMATRYGIWLVPVLLLGAPAYVFDGLFLGLTEGRVLRNSMLLATGLVFLPLAVLAVATGANHLLWLAMTGFMAARTATLARAASERLAEWRAETIDADAVGAWENRRARSRTRRRSRAGSAILAAMDAGLRHSQTVRRS
ncbi:MAG: MATE family efflux transporter [Acidobacteriota bacterium]|nr:MATE family efflux transporter [Acidobacteriota bacterium]